MNEYNFGQNIILAYPLWGRSKKPLLFCSNLTQKLLLHLPRKKKYILSEAPVAEWTKGDVKFVAATSGGKRSEVEGTPPRLELGFNYTTNGIELILYKYILDVSECQKLHNDENNRVLQRIGKTSAATVL